MCLKEILRPKKITLALSILVVIFFLIVILNGICCLAIYECPEGQMRISVPPHFPGERCCQVCGSETERAIIGFLFNPVIELVLIFILSYIIISTAYYLFTRKKKLPPKP